MSRFIFSLIGMLLLAVSVSYADNFSITKTEQQKITDEAENWIDDMPVGMQDRLSDAVSHAMQGFYSEIEYFRNVADTTDINKYKVSIQDISAKNGPVLALRVYKSPNKTTSSRPLLIYFHGGGWSVGSLKVTEKFCRALASTGNVNVISVDYPLSPEHTYPDALKDCEETVKWIYSKVSDFGSNSNLISLGGDGAGGNLAFSLSQSLPSSFKIKSLVLYYPLLKTGGELDIADKREYGRGYGFDSRLWSAFIEAYKGETPAFSSKIPSTLLIGGGRDIIISQLRDFASSNNAVNYVEFEGALHGFITDGHQTTAFQKAIELTDKFLTSK